MIVVKIGGDLLYDGLSQNLVDELKSIYEKDNLVMVHGGGDIVTDIATKLGHKPRFVVSLFYFFSHLLITVPFLCSKAKLIAFSLNPEAISTSLTSPSIRTFPPKEMTLSWTLSSATTISWVIVKHC